MKDYDFDSIEYNEPKWITSPLSPSDIAAINQGGCESGSYMPAVTYHTANQIMAEMGDDVLQYLQDQMGELPQPPHDISWSQLATFYLSRAVEWHCMVYSDLEDWENEDQIAA